ncbi:FAD synthetase 1, chloroplastic-like [Prosopis cineraria]|uniref:FAD synthetase 1, chloroplastic-like n=1 Tax=Prosopis cineraria TaxID=364024 RepID=UPI00240EB342|nr:FAD synthetase 1, chloroplastic-like [Prosopis cineraria]
MLLGGGSRISHHLRECDLRFHLSCRFRYYSSQIVQLSFPSPLNSSLPCLEKQIRLSSSSSSSSSSCIPAFHPSLLIVSGRNTLGLQLCMIELQIPIIHLLSIFSGDCSCIPVVQSPHIVCVNLKEVIYRKLLHIYQREDDQEVISDGLSPIAGGVVALGKFDALHIGHRELAIQASRAGPPFLLSFAGMAEVLGWEQRAPVVAKCDRKRVLSSWAPYCCNMVPKEYQVEFSRVRHLSPRQFVEKLSKELRVRGVVAGENYRFGYKAAGDASELVKLCQEYGMEAYVIKSVMDKNQNSATFSTNNPKEKGQVSSTRVRQALAVGDMRYVTELLGRQHRVVLMATDPEGFSVGNFKFSAPKSCLMNLAPKEGLYENCYLFLDQDSVVQCRIVVDTEFVHVEIADLGLSDNVRTQHFQLLQIEFAGSSS